MVGFIWWMEGWFHLVDHWYDYYHFIWWIGIFKHSELCGWADMIWCGKGFKERILTAVHLATAACEYYGWIGCCRALEHWILCFGQFICVGDMMFLILDRYSGRVTLCAMALLDLLHWLAFMGLRNAGVSALFPRVNAFRRHFPASTTMVVSFTALEKNFDWLPYFFSLSNGLRLFGMFIQAICA